MYEQIDSNKRKTWLIMSGFLVVIGLIGAFIGYYYDDYSISIIMLVIAFLYALIQYYFGAKMAIAMSGATEVTDHRSDFYRIVENLSITAGLPMPKVYISEDLSPNAFATGRDPEHAIVCATRGLLNILEPKEIEAVMAHEMAHVGNYDIKINLVAFALSVMISFLSQIFFRLSFGSRRRNKEGGGVLLVLGLVSVILAPIIASIIRMALSRNREYLADATAALTTRDPESLASALTKISQSSTTLMNQNPSMAGMYINNPIKADFFGKIFSTHPPVEERIKRLREMNL